MKRILIIALLILLVFPGRVKAEEYHTAKATWYCLKGKTAAGTKTREGIVASKREWIGKTMVLYRDQGDHLIKPENFMGIYEIEDTSKVGSPVAKGYVIDIWCPSYDEAIQNGCIDVIFQIVESEG